MAIALETDPTPLKMDSDGVIRVAGTRVTLDTVVTAFMEGASAEEIAVQYPSLELADVYSVIGFFLRHSSDVNRYLDERQQQADRVRQRNLSLFSAHGVRQRLMARRDARHK